MSPRLAIGSALVLFTAGCGPSGNGHTQPAVTLSVTNPSVLIGVGKTSQLAATERLSDSSLVTITNQATWTSSNPSVFTISSSGLLTTTGIGAATISASYQSLTVTRTLTVQPLVATSLKIAAPPTFTAAGQTQPLTAMVTFNDGSSQDVSSSAQWSSNDPSVADVSTGGLASSSALGIATIIARYSGLTAVATLTVTPPGTFATQGRVRLPGAGNSEGLGVPDFTITNGVTGVSVQSDALGQFNLGGLTSGTHLVFTKSDFETAEMVPVPTYSEVTVQKVVRITAGDTVTSVIRENDIVYDPSPTFHCDNCRLIRVVNPADGTLHVVLSWTNQSTMTIWANGTVIGPAKGGTLTGDIPVTAGELLLYIRLVGGNTTVTLATSTSSPSPNSSDSSDSSDSLSPLSHERQILAPQSKSLRDDAEQRNPDRAGEAEPDCDHQQRLGRGRFEQRHDERRRRDRDGDDHGAGQHGDAVRIAGRPGL
jgi:hypothetical protein